MTLSANLPVAVDATGGDLGLKVQVEGAVCALKEFGVDSIIVGPQGEIEDLIRGLGASSLNIKIRNATETITMEDSPVRAVRKKPDSSLCVAYNLVNSGEASSIISAGNTGAMMAAGKLLTGLLPGIERPAIATLIPNVGENKPTVILDAGANVDCSAHHLIQFAIMGSVYCETLLGIDSPKIGILSNGAEDSKGNDITKSAAQILKSRERLNYIGYVEGRDVATSMVDVVVCDGFVGNVLLKSMEGAVKLVVEQLKYEAQRSLLNKIRMAASKSVLKNVFKNKFDYSAYGGAPLLGLKKLALVLHGSSDERAVKNAIRVAKEFCEKKMTENIAEEMVRMEEFMQSDVSVSI